MPAPAAAASDALDAAFEQLRQREAQASALAAQQEDALRRLAQWQAEVGAVCLHFKRVTSLFVLGRWWLKLSSSSAPVGSAPCLLRRSACMVCATSPPPAITRQEAELAAAQQEVTELERRLFGSPGPGTPEASQERQLVLLDALFAMEAPSEEGGSSEEGSAHQVSWLATAGRQWKLPCTQLPCAGPPPCCASPRLLPTVAAFSRQLRQGFRTCEPVAPLVPISVRCHCRARARWRRCACCG